MRSRRGLGACAADDAVLPGRRGLPCLFCGCRPLAADYPLLSHVCGAARHGCRPNAATCRLPSKQLPALQPSMACPLRLHSLWFAHPPAPASSTSATEEVLTTALAQSKQTLQQLLVWREQIERQVGAGHGCWVLSGVVVTCCSQLAHAVDVLPPPLLAIKVRLLARTLLLMCVPALLILPILCRLRRSRSRLTAWSLR